jgi:hypothetical protein
MSIVNLDQAGFATAAKPLPPGLPELSDFVCSEPWQPSGPRAAAAAVTALETGDAPDVIVMELTARAAAAEWALTDEQASALQDTTRPLDR